MSRKVILKGAIFLILAQMVMVLTGYLIRVGIARQLGPSLFGIYGIVLSLVTIVGIFVTKGTPQVVSMAISSGADLRIVKRAALKYQSILTVTIFCLYQMAVGTIAKLLGGVELVPYLRIGGFIPLFSSVYSVIVGCYNGQSAFGTQAFLQITHSVLKFLLVFGFLIAGLGLNAILFSHALIPLLIFLGAVLMSGLGKKGIFDYRDFFDSTWPITLYFVVLNILIAIDLFLLRSITGLNEVVGIYSAVLSLASLPFTVLISISSLLLPSISRNLAERDMESARSNIMEVMKFLILLLLPATLLIASTSEALIELVYSEEYLLGALPLSIVVFGYAFLAVFHVLNTVIMTTENVVFPLFVVMAVSGLSLVLNYNLVSLYGATGAAFSTTISILVGMIISAGWVYKKFAAIVDFKALLVIAFSVLIITVISNTFKLRGLSLLLEYSILSLIYLGVLFQLKVIEKQDILDIVKSVIAK
ncbi:oligosaccharide flippase family protein [Patescibacteria group bacterium]|nr:oligosaccharide flippase family protein [Patescibacteria group bacterium]MBU1868569.1 oligosaccharide flippase family protein [Patescibacteria group bacterium]